MRIFQLEKVVVEKFFDCLIGKGTFEYCIFCIIVLIEESMNNKVCYVSKDLLNEM